MAELNHLTQPTTVVAGTTPTQQRRHAIPTRGMQSVPSAPFVEGRFGRMFRNLPVFDPADRDLETLAAKMIQPQENDKDPEKPDNDENLEIPAGYTYLGQFIDHDITFDPVSSLQRQNDPDALVDFRTPRFDLDNLYGRGPDDQPYLYQADGVKLLTGKAVSSDREISGPDLPRNLAGRALIGDPRNDENKIVSQLQSLFIRFHNALADLVPKETNFGNGDLLKECQKRVRWHYQWIVIHDFLPRILAGRNISAGEEIIRSILAPQQFLAGIKHGAICKSEVLRPSLKFYLWREQPFIPVEFSVAAYRFGHSMIRPRYFFNDKIRQPKQAAAFGRTPIFSLSPDPTANMNSFQPLPADWGFQWKYFFEVGGSAPDFAKFRLPQPSYKIDTQLPFPLENLPSPILAVSDKIRSLAERNLKRGKALGLPCGQDVARAMGIAPLTTKDLELDKIGLAGSSIDGNTPLWFYILKEAETLGAGNHLGPVGGRIVAEVIIGLLWGDPFSYLRVQPNWSPNLADKTGKFSMAELINFALS